VGGSHVTWNQASLPLSFLDKLEMTMGEMLGSFLPAAGPKGQSVCCPYTLTTIVRQYGKLVIVAGMFAPLQAQRSKA
jgi:hypothetical protein